MIISNDADPIKMLEAIDQQLSSSTYPPYQKIVIEKGRLWQVLTEVEKRAERASRKDLVDQCKSIRSLLEKSPELYPLPQKGNSWVAGLFSKITDRSIDTATSLFMRYGNWQKSSIGPEELKRALLQEGFKPQLFEVIQKIAPLFIKEWCQHLADYQNSLSEPPLISRFLFLKNQSSGIWERSRVGRVFAEILLVNKGDTYSLNEQTLSETCLLLEVVLVQFLVNLSQASQKGFEFPPEVERPLKERLLEISQKKEGIPLETFAEPIANYFLSLGFPYKGIIKTLSFEGSVLFAINYLVKSTLESSLASLLCTFENTLLGKESSKEKVLSVPEIIKKTAVISFSCEGDKPQIFTKKDSQELSSLLGKTIARSLHLPDSKSQLIAVPRAVGEIGSILLRGFFKKEYFKTSINTTAYSLTKNGLSQVPLLIKKTIPVLLLYVNNILNSYNGKEEAPPGIFFKLFDKINLEHDGKKTDYYELNEPGQFLENILSHSKTKKGLEAYLEAILLSIVNSFIEKLESDTFNLPKELVDKTSPKECRIKRVKSFILDECFPSKEELELPPIFDLLKPILYELLAIPLERQLTPFFEKLDKMIEDLPLKIESHVTIPLCRKATNEILNIQRKKEIVETKSGITIQDITTDSLFDIFGEDFLLEIKEFAPLRREKQNPQEFNQEPLFFQGVFEIGKVLLIHQLQTIQFTPKLVTIPKRSEVLTFPFAQYPVIDSENLRFFKMLEYTHEEVSRKIYEKIKPVTKEFTLKVLRAFTEDLKIYIAGSLIKPPSRILTLTKEVEKVGHKLTDPGKLLYRSLQLSETQQFITEAVAYVVSTTCVNFMEKIRTGELQLPKALFIKNIENRKKIICDFVFKFLPPFETLPLPPMLNKFKEEIYDILTDITKGQISSFISLLDFTIEHLPQIINKEIEKKKEETSHLEVKTDSELSQKGLLLGCTIGSFVLEAACQDKASCKKIQDRINQEKVKLELLGCSPDVLNGPRDLISKFISAIELGLDCEYKDTPPPEFLRKTFFTENPVGVFSCNKLGNLFLEALKETVPINSVNFERSQLSRKQMKESQFFECLPITKKDYVLNVLEANILITLSNLLGKKEDTPLNIVNVIETVLTQINQLYRSTGANEVTQGSISLMQTFIEKNPFLLDNLEVPLLLKEVTPLFFQFFSSTLALGFTAVCSTLEEKTIPLTNKALNGALRGNQRVKKFAKGVAQELHVPFQEKSLLQTKVNSISDQLSLFVNNFFPEFIIPKFVIKLAVSEIVPYAKVPANEFLNGIFKTIEKNKITPENILDSLSSLSNKKNNEIFEDKTPEIYIRRFISSKKDKIKLAIHETRFGLSYMRLRLKLILLVVIECILPLCIRKAHNPVKTIGERTKEVISLIKQVQIIRESITKGI